MNDLINEAQLLAQSFPFEYLKKQEETFEDFYNTHTSEYYDPIIAKKCFDLMTTYLIAMSMKELDWKDKN